MPECLPRRVEIVLIKVKYLFTEAEHCIFQKREVVGEGRTYRESNTHSGFHKEQVPLRPLKSVIGEAGLGCFYVG